MYLLDLFISLVIFKLWGSHTAVEKLYPHACCTLFMNLLVPELMLEKDCSITFENKPMFFLSFVEGREACSLHYHWSWYIFTYETRRHRQLKLINKLRLTLRSNRGRAGMKRYSIEGGQEWRDIPLQKEKNSAPCLKPGESAIRAGLHYDFMETKGTVLSL